MQQGQEYDSTAVSAVSRIATEVLARPTLRKSFAADPVGTLERAGIDSGAIPDRLLDTLADLSYEELEVVSRVNRSLLDSGAPVPPGYEHGIIF